MDKTSNREEKQWTVWDGRLENEGEWKKLHDKISGVILGITIIKIKIK